MDGSQLPVGFIMALAQNSRATAYFGSLSEEEQQKVIQKAAQAPSRQEMRRYVQGLGRTQTD